MKKSTIAIVALICCVIIVAAAAAIVLTEDNEKDLNLDELADGLEEIEVKINEGGKWELNGKITTHADRQSDVAVVIVHGSGPSDMDGTQGDNKIYRDIAWGLAQFDVDVLRYDKRTLVYGNSSADDIRKLTVKEETIDDAIAAAELMKDLGYEKVFLIGHSMGGMLAPAIVKESNGAFDGFVSMAGSPRTFSELQIDQNRALATNQMESDYIEEIIKPEIEKLEKLNSWNESQLLSNTIFGVPAYYLKDMAGRDAGEIALSLDVPMLFLQGSADSQVYADKDYAMWQDILADKEETEFKLYDGLNHLFMKSSGDRSELLGMYEKGHVNSNVIKDIAEFIKG